MSSQYTPITFPAWFQPSVTLAYQIILDAYSQSIAQQNVSVTISGTTYVTFSYTNKFQHTEFAFSAYASSSVNEYFEFELIIDGTTYITSPWINIPTTSTSISFSGAFNLPVGTHTCKIVIIAGTQNATVTIASNIGIGNTVTGSNGGAILSVTTMTRNEIAAILLNYDGIFPPTQVAGSSLTIYSKNNVFQLNSSTINNAFGSKLQASTPTNYVLGNGDTTQQVNISSPSGDTSHYYALIRSIVINEASTIIQNLSLIHI